jgi:hypothetical protein
MDTTNRISAPELFDPLPERLKPTVRLFRRFDCSDWEMTSGGFLPFPFRPTPLGCLRHPLPSLGGELPARPRETRVLPGASHRGREFCPATRQFAEQALSRVTNLRELFRDLLALIEPGRGFGLGGAQDAAEILGEGHHAGIG